MRAHPWLLLPLAAITSSASATTYLSTEQAQSLIFPGASLISTGKPGVWHTSNGRVFVVDRVVGKHEFITFAVGINPNGTVKQVEILQYNESYGYEVREASWRAQFVGKSAASALQLNADIKNISGATLSSKHVTDGVKRVLQTYAPRGKGD
ncbi:MAG TPA: FMN-binding protein [Pseudolabrys sp.]|nr:FMN-binding protein [Pseudolabrys sp.]